MCCTESVLANWQLDEYLEADDFVLCNAGRLQTRTGGVLGAVPSAAV